MQSRRAAHIAAILLAMIDSPLDWSFYFLAWDNCLFNQEFQRFFSPEGLKNVMYIHWNEAPHRFGLFGEGGQVRPQYFVYQILSRMGEERLACASEQPDLHILSARLQNRLSTLVVNFNLRESFDRIAKIHYRHLRPGLKRITAYRIDDDQRWDAEQLELTPIEQRTVDVLPEFSYQFYCPADSVLRVTLEDLEQG